MITLLSDGRALCILFLVLQTVSAEPPNSPRWGQAVALVESTLFVHGGRTDKYNAYSYTQAPVTSDLFSLSLLSPFDVANPPWQILPNTPQDPAVAWHTLTPFNTTSLLLFGGDTGPNSPVVLPSVADSGALLNISSANTPSWTIEPQTWANEPLRRIYHTASTFGGKVFIVGGMKDDGSGMAFSDHYVFDPSSPSFATLPSTDSPPDIAGHQAIVTPDGRLLIFGGYAPSVKDLLPFSTVWSLDLTQPNANWEQISVSTDTLPPPRRGFAAALCDGGKLFIHGGADAVMQTTFSDGWVLDTSKQPMVWSPVPALSQLGLRRDHFALCLGSQVIFGFGYSQNGGASPPLQLFDAGAGTFITSYTPPSAITTPTVTTLPVPSQTGGASHPQGSGTTSGTPVYGSGEIPYPTGSPGGSHGGGGGNNGHGGGGGNGTGPNDPDGPLSGGSSKGGSGMVIALSTVFGVLALVLVVVAVWYVRRRRSRENFQHLLDESGDEGDDEWHVIPVATMRERNAAPLPPALQTVRDRLSGLMPERFSHQPDRLDMLAEEDAREYNQPLYNFGREPSSGRSSQASRRSWRRQPLEKMVDSLSSLRYAGEVALNFAADAGTRRSRRKEGSSASSVSSHWPSEKQLLPYGSYLDEMGTMSYTQTTDAARPRGGRQGSSYSYHDPFQEYEVEPLALDSIRRDEPAAMQRMPSLNDPPPRPRVEIATMGSRTSLNSKPLTPVTEQSVTDHASSSETSLARSPGLSPFLSSDSSQTSHDPAYSPRRPSSILDTSAPPSSLMRRSNSWWSRFAKTSLLDRRSSNRSEHRLLDAFKDPNPPPRLMPIRESIHSTSPESPTDKQRSGSGSSGHKVYPSTQHARSMSSLQTARTADSETLERMAQTMQIVQKGTISSHTSGKSLSMDSRDESPERRHPSDVGRPLSVIASSRSLLEGEAADMVLSPTTMTQEESMTSMVALAPPLRPTKSDPERGSSSSNVAARIQAYERRMSQHTADPLLKIPPPIPSRTRKPSAYGLAPKSPLFVANPDKSRSGSGSS